MLIDHAEFEEDDEIDDHPVSHVLTPALGCQRPDTAAPCSIFELADKPVKLRRGAFPGGGWGKEQKPQVARIDYEDGIMRVAGDSYPSRNMEVWDGA